MNLDYQTLFQRNYGIFEEAGATRTTRVSVSSDGAQGTFGASSGPSISADGRHVAFDSYAADLVSGDTNEQQDVFAHDRGEYQGAQEQFERPGPAKDPPPIGDCPYQDGRQIKDDEEP